MLFRAGGREKMFANRAYSSGLFASPDRGASLLYFAAAIPAVGFCASGNAISMCRGLPEKIGIHNPSFLFFGFSSDPLNAVHEPPQISRHEDLVFGSDVGTPVDLDLRVIDILE